MSDIWRTHDYRGRVVILTADRRQHILRRHGEMEGRLDEVRAAVDAPDVVTRDRRFAHRELYYRRVPASDSWTKVVIRYYPVSPQGTWEGEIITAHRVEHPGCKEEPLAP